MSGHPLLEAARRARVEGLAPLALGRETPLPDLWRELAQASRGSEASLAQALAASLKIPVADFLRIDPTALKLLPERVSRQYTVFPLRQDDRQIVVASANPTDLDVEQAVRFATGRNPSFELAPPSAIERAIEMNYSPDQSIRSLLRSLGAAAADAMRVVNEVDGEPLTDAEVESGPVVRLANLILHYAVSERASDIHLEPERAQGIVRFRVDGVMREFMQIALPAFNRVVARIKIVGKLDIADRLRPQDGRARVQVGERQYDLRISTVPTRQSEKVVIRILGTGSASRLEDLALAPAEMERIRRILAHRNGIVAVTGPTGSGKTTTLYAVIRELATGSVNITTVEDPIEYELPGITQLQVEPKRSVTFASALRAILRQDPDVILVGEIRDRETAEMAIQASLTGHLVLTTLHTNDALGAISRLADLGVDRKAIAATLRGALAQRLVRRICPSCVAPASGDLSAAEERLAARYGVKSQVRASGCRHCAFSGFRGRQPLIESLLVSAEVGERIAADAGATAIAEAAARAGLRPLIEAGLDAVRYGLTSLEEIDRVLGDAASPDGAAAAAPAAPVSASSSGSMSAAGSEARVLVVDDEPVSRTLARTLLEKAGYKVVEAEDGNRALALLASGISVQLVVTDLHMPRLDGRGLLAELRRHPSTAALPVMVFTSSDNPEGEAAVIDAGADDYIRKPLDPGRFTSRVKAALRRAGY